MEIQIDPQKGNPEASRQTQIQEQQNEDKSIKADSNPSNNYPNSTTNTTSTTSNQIPNYQLLYTARGHQKSISAIKFSPDGTMLVSSSSDTYLKVWSVRTGQLIKTFVGHEKGINDVVWSSCNQYLASASDDGSVRIWSVRSGDQLRLLTGHTSFVFCLAYNPQSSLIISGSFDETARLWDVRRGTCHRTIPAHSEAVSSVSFNRDGTMIVTGSYDGLIRLWDTSTGQCLATLVNSGSTTSPIASIVFTPSSSQLLATSLDSTIRLWDVNSSKILKTFKGHLRDKFAGGAILTKGRTIKSDELAMSSSTSSKSQNGTDTLMKDSEESTERGEENGSGDQPNGMTGKDKNEKQTALQSLPEVYVICGSEDQRVYVWNLQTKKLVQTLIGHRDVVISVDVHPFLPVLASASLDQDPCIKVWLDRSFEGF